MRGSPPRRVLLQYILAFSFCTLPLDSLLLSLLAPARCCHAGLVGVVLANGEPGSRGHRLRRRRFRSGAIDIVWHVSSFCEFVKSVRFLTPSYSAYAGEGLHVRRVLLWGGSFSLSSFLSSVGSGPGVVTRPWLAWSFFFLSSVWRFSPCVGFLGWWLGYGQYAY